jgi:hypothetical protein
MDTRVLESCRRLALQREHADLNGLAQSFARARDRL